MSTINDSLSKMDEILINFQSCTGIEDATKAIQLLEQNDWNLEVALKNYFPESSQNDERSGHGNTRECAFCDGITVDSIPSGSGSNQIDVQVHYHENEVANFCVLDSIKLSQLKSLISSVTRYTPQEQILSGWSSEPESDDKTLAELGSTNRIHLFLITRPINTHLYNDDGLEKQLLTFANLSKSQDSELGIRKLKILDETSNRDYILIVYVETTVLTVKHYISFITGIPTGNQVWTGWPIESIDDTSWIGIVLPNIFYNCLKVRPRECFDSLDTDSSRESYEDASDSFNTDDEIFSSDITQEKIIPIIPKNVEDETVGSVHFIDGFMQRYGQTAPNFFPGSLEMAMAESCMKPAKDRRTLAVYLHHDGSPLSKTFCKDILCSEIVLHSFEHYTLFWGWDLTDESNKNMFLASSMKSLGPSITETVRNMTVTVLPVLLIVSKCHSVVKLSEVIYGATDLNKFVDVMMQIVSKTRQMQESELKNEEQRAIREREMAEQDLAFQESLFKDKAKAEAIKQKLLMESQEEERKRQKIEEDTEKKNKEQSNALAKISPEPTEDCKEIVTMKFRTPSGDTFHRRFLLTENVEVVFNYLLSKGYRLGEYKIMMSWPKREITLSEESKTLKDLNLHFQEVINIEER
ncbi:FAS-associated factor 1-like [Cimex lectularius]|uniref:UBX domain-containing protein n=1 Tax=Cimex lectularius TaxID=79782 RepID=A0A8I6SDP5_CIMLE|nr:FAS-associated factor 1-like [Cimex lectularius]